ncbi:MAG: hypothetical protein Kow0089_00770 [Desulfobulbaceae bacterium]
MLALLVHAATFGLSATLPELLHRGPILDEVVTVDLVSLPDSSPAANDSSVSEPAPEQVSSPPKKAEVAVSTVPKAPPAEVKKVRPISLKPVRRKVRKTDPKKIAAEEERRRRELERQRALARARQEEEAARRAAEEARAALAAMLRSSNTESAPPDRRSSGRKKVSSIVEQNYYSALYDRVKQFWVLPEMRHWDPTLETRVVVTILRDGTIARTIVEKKSRDPFYDQFVMKTLEKASPLPPIPKLMARNSVEIGFRFKPGGVASIGR